MRQVFYRLVSQRVIERAEAEHTLTVCRLLTELRLSGPIPFAWIADNTRWMRKPRAYATLQDALRQTAQFYRRRVWDDQDVYIEVW